ncbi:MAG: PocR ligand-binding domain-containing protein [Methanobacteriota archaeon]|nr:MAG: PocR ligand-binding domain-containing protein [Euryarchaeota archaeon]
MDEEEGESKHSFHQLAERIRKETDELILSDLIDKDLLKGLQDSFVEATGMVVGIFDNEFHSIIPNSPWSRFCTLVDGAVHEKCLKADREAVDEALKSSDPVIQKCFACDTVFFAAPIVIQDKVMGCILGGQVRTKSPDVDEVKSFAKDIGVDEEELAKAALEMRFYPEEQLMAWADLLQSISGLVADIGHERAISSRIENRAQERATELEQSAESLEEEVKERTGELRMFELRYKNLFEQSNDAVFIHTLDGKIVDVNSRVEELLGYTKEELLEIPVPKLHTENTIPDSEEAFERIMTERSVRFDSAMIRKDGSVVPVEISSRIFETDGDELIQGIVRDISERTRFVSLLKKARDVLEQKVHERTAALTASKRELEKKLRDFEHFEDVLFEREMKISKLEDEVSRLKKMMAKKSGAAEEEPPS